MAGAAREPQWATVKSTNPLEVLVDGAEEQGPATAPSGVGLAGDQRVLTLLVGRTLVVIGAYAVPAAPAAATVLVPGDDGSVWQVKATSMGTLYTQKVS